MSTWFGASQFFEATHELPSVPDALWEERVVLVQARDEAEALALADKIGRDSEHEYMVAVPERHMLRWRYRGTERVYEMLSATPAQGVEVFSRFLEPELAASLLRGAGAVTPGSRPRHAPSTDIKTIVKAATAGETADALALTTALLAEHPDCPYLLVFQAILIQAQDRVAHHTLEDAETSLLQAHHTDGNYLPALEELAHYYDAVSPDAVKARAFAAAYIEKSASVLDEMRAIVNQV